MRTTMTWSETWAGTTRRPMALHIKHGVRIQGLTPETVLALQVIEGAFRDAGYNCVLTSGVDGKHSSGSLHYVGCAVDLRTRDIPEQKREPLRQEIARRLGPDFDVVLEKDHLHIEHQPKVPLSHAVA